MQDEAMRELLLATREIAVLGIKADPAEDAYRVAAYLQATGHRILPVNPKLATVLGEPCVPGLASLEAPVDLIDVFRAPRHLPAHVDEILSLPTPPRAVWFQLGIRDDASAARLEAAGISVVQDRCLMVEHRRLLAGGAR
ncbi:MAG: CoA-binding protein [Myxococcales bacterium]|nr:CoA-binding protein [Myxococcales bacterium]